jgi:hypothetical protein
MMKLRIATGVGLLLFMATMIGGPVRASQAQDDGGGVTLASLAGKFAGRASGFETLCYNATFTALALAPRCRQRNGCHSMLQRFFTALVAPPEMPAQSKP